MDLVPNKEFRAVLVFPVRGDEVCLPWKKRKIGAGKRNGYGGGINQDETDRDAAVREIAEEGGISIDPEQLRLRAFCHFITKYEEGEAHCFVDVFTLDMGKVLGELHESKEMGKPEWFPKDNLPMHELMPADKIWLPHILYDKKFRVHAVYGPKQQILLSPVHMEQFWIAKDQPRPHGQPRDDES